MADHEDDDDTKEQGGHGGVAAVSVPLGDGVVVSIRLKYNIPLNYDIFPRFGM